jgi:cytochrome b6-f complex iron-sulfur subunit
LYVAIVIGLILVVAAVSVVLLANRARASTGGLSRETRRRDADAAAAGPAPASTEVEAAGRERADETRASLGGALTRRRGGAVVEYEPVDEEELGVTRRQFLNRGLLTAVGFGLAGFAPAMLAFLWPFRATGFGGKFTVGTVAEIKAYIAANRKPKYEPQARTYLVPFPSENRSAIEAAKRIYKPAVVNAMEQGIVGLYQRCVHLGCRVPFCETSQWFECPCHGSKYSRVGEKTAGPAPRGLDSFLLTFDGGRVTIDTSTIFNGAPIGTDTTGQEPEGPLCV